MKYRIKFANGRWSVVEPNGEVTWHFPTLGAACEWVRKMTKENAI